MTWRTDFTGATHEEIAAAVSQVLRAHGITSVMSGGGCVSVYSHNKYYSDDLDFIDSHRDKKKIQEALAAIAFYGGDKDRYFRNQTTGIYLEFPPGPVMIGNEMASGQEWQTPSGKILMLSPTDCVKDRLAQFYAWGDCKGLYQALLVATSQPILISEVKRWSLESEHEKEGYALFLSLYKRARKEGDLSEDVIIEAATDWKLEQRAKKNKGKGGYVY